MASDGDLAQLLSIFQDQSIDQLQHYLNKYKTVENTIDFLINQSSHQEKRDSSKNALQLLSSKEIVMQKKVLSASNIDKYLPGVLFERFLDDDLANDLLLELMEESKEWHVRKFSLFGKNVESPHTCAFYIDESRKSFGNQVSDSEQSSYSGIPGHKSESRAFLSRMIKARDLVESCVQKQLSTRTKHELEIQGLWQSNICVANKYRNHDQGVGSHADRLTFLGPMPTIASLTLGAERIFRVKKIISHDNPSTFDIALPHNSLLIMFAPFQEEYKHEIPKCKASGIKPHRVSGAVRINLTFRVARPNYCNSVRFCKCGNPCDLRIVTKNEKNRGKYFYMCASAGSVSLKKPMGYTCGHFEWMKPC